MLHLESQWERWTTNKQTNKELLIPFQIVLGGVCLTLYSPKRKQVDLESTETLAYLSWSPTGFILNGDGLAERVGLSSEAHCPCGSTGTFTTLGACSGWTILFATLYSEGGRCRGMDERCVSCFLFLSCLRENCIFSFSLYSTYWKKLNCMLKHELSIVIENSSINENNLIFCAAKECQKTDLCTVLSFNSNIMCCSSCLIKDISVI